MEINEDWWVLPRCYHAGFNRGYLAAKLAIMIFFGKARDMDSQITEREIIEHLDDVEKRAFCVAPDDLEIDKLKSFEDMPVRHDYPRFNDKEDGINVKNDA